MSRRPYRPTHRDRLRNAVIGGGVGYFFGFWLESWRFFL